MNPHRIAPLLLATTLLAASAPGLAAPIIRPGPEEIYVKTTPIPHFRIGYPDQSRFGRLTYLGGFEMWSKTRHFGALSGILSRDGGDRILAVTDNGFWLDARIEQDDMSRPTGISNVRLAPMLNAKGRAISGGHDADAEAIVIQGDTKNPRLLVAFERNHRIDAYSLDLKSFLSRPKRLRAPGAIRRLRHNRGLEALAIAPKTCPMPGAVIAIAERARNKAKDTPAWIIGGPRPGMFRIKLKGDYGVTDAAFLPDGDLLVLERKFNFAEGVGMRLRRISCSALRPGRVADGTVLIEADFGYQIDNMEGLAVHTDRRGNVILTIVSDDNRSILQRSLFLRFRLSGPPLPKPKDLLGLRRSAAQSVPQAAE